MKYSITLALAAFFALTLTGCSVKMAADKKGTDLAELQECETRTCLEIKGAEPISVDKYRNDPQIQAYKVRKSTGSTARAVMHGVLDVATLGLWEVAGTPMEGHFNEDEYYGLRVTFESDAETIRTIELAK